MLRATESEILQQFDKTFTEPNMQGHSVAELEHVKCPSVALESVVSVSSHSVVDQPGRPIGEHEQRSAFSETHVSLDSVHDCVMVCVVFWCVSLCFPPVLITAPSPNVSQLFLVACLVFAT